MKFIVFITLRIARVRYKFGETYRSVAAVAVSRPSFGFLSHPGNQSVLGQGFSDGVFSPETSSLSTSGGGGCYIGSMNNKSYGPLFRLLIASSAILWRQRRATQLAY